jgi:stage II sporulation protein GA (sporulation sigma-E factor processing peptidase)
MKVYIEFVIIDNMIIDTLIGYLCINLFRYKLNVFRLVFSAFIGTIFAIFSPFLTINGIYSIILKFFIGLILSTIIIPDKLKINKILLFNSAYLLITFIFGGLIYSLSLIYNVNNQNFPVGFVVLGVFIYAKFLYKFINTIYKKKQIQNFCYKVKLVVNKKEYNFTAFLDSGNRLFDNYENLPVFIIDYKLLDEFKVQDNLMNFILGKYKRLPFKNVHIIQCSTINSHNNIIVFSPDSLIVIENNIQRECSCLIGLSFKNFNRGIEYKGLLSPSIVRGVYDF